MRRLPAALLAALLTAGLPSLQAMAADPAHNSRNALDWAGVYEGVTPCADCPGIEMRLTLHPDGRFELRTRYLERDVAPRIAQGTFGWDASGGTITLGGQGLGQQFRVGEGRLLQMNHDGSAPPWDAPHRVLLRQAQAATPPTPAAATPPRRNAEAALVRALQANHWTLRSGSEAGGQAIDGLLVPDHAFVMHFDGARVNIRGGCNAMTGGWRLDPNGQLLIGRLASTMKACEAALMKADAALSSVLAHPLQTALQPGPRPEAAASLRLSSASGQTLSFTGQPTMESRYGAPTRVFLEVAPQTVECVSGVMRTQCLRVRERRFDANGLRIEPPGEWQNFHGSIDGYTHTPGVRNVLRINRYQRKQVPADASRYIYVLDMVVESETVAK
jgi:heat shock protein HslJ